MDRRGHTHTPTGQGARRHRLLISALPHTASTTSASFSSASASSLRPRLGANPRANCATPLTLAGERVAVAGCPRLISAFMKLSPPASSQPLSSPRGQEEEHVSRGTRQTIMMRVLILWCLLRLPSWEAVGTIELKVSI